MAPIFFSGQLMTLEKTSGVIRLIAIGYTLRRIAARFANAYATAARRLLEASSTRRRHARHMPGGGSPNQVLHGVDANWPLHGETPVLQHVQQLALGLDVGGGAAEDSRHLHVLLPTL